MPSNPVVGDVPNPFGMRTATDTSPACTAASAERESYGAAIAPLAASGDAAALNPLSSSSAFTSRWETSLRSSSTTATWTGFMPLPRLPKIPAKMEKNAIGTRKLRMRAPRSRRRFMKPVRTIERIIRGGPFRSGEGIPIPDSAP